jgi:alpha-1,2-mannosyltransferase
VSVGWIGRLRVGGLARPSSVAVRRLAFLLLALGVAFAIALLVELALPVRDSAHHDFLAFYGAGRLIVAGDPSGIYDAARLGEIQRAIMAGPVGVNGYMPFINPPFAAAAFAPLATLSPELARAVWTGIGLVLLLVAALAIAGGPTGRDRALGILLVGLSFPAYHALAEGQWSILLLASGLAAVAAGRRGRWALVGLALVPFWIKPQLLVLPLVGLLLARRWRAVAAVGVGGAALVLIGLPFTGIGPYERYVGYLAEVVTSHFTGAGAVDQTIWQGNLATTEGLNGLLVGYLGQGSVGVVNVLWLVAACALLALYGLAARRQPPGFATLRARMMLAAGILVTLLVNPNLFTQDCVLVFVALAALWPLPRRLALPAIVGTVALVDLILLDQAAITVHVFTIALVALVVLACLRAPRRPRRAHSPAAPVAPAGPISAGAGTRRP